VIAVAVPVPGLGLLSYRVPAGCARPDKGARVRVPLGRRAVVGYVVAPEADPPAGTELRDLEALIDDEPLLPAAVVDLALWVGEYYACGPGDAISAAVPPLTRTGRSNAFRTRLVVAATAEGRTASGPFGPRQRSVL
jgi:primosomal protein N' (replication factor Y)